MVEKARHRMMCEVRARILRLGNRRKANRKTVAGLRKLYLALRDHDDRKTLPEVQEELRMQDAQTPCPYTAEMFPDLATTPAPEPDKSTLMLAL